VLRWIAAIDPPKEDAMAVIVQINYRRPDMPKPQWEQRYTDELARKFLDVGGLQWKIWLDDDATQGCGGIYLFADRKAAQEYVDGPIVASMKANQALSDLSIRIFDVRARMSEITHAPVPGLPLAAE
jgi:hypothetical protein